MNITSSFNKKSYSGGGCEIQVYTKKLNLKFSLGFAPTTFWPLKFQDRVGKSEKICHILISNTLNFLLHSIFCKFNNTEKLTFP